MARKAAPVTTESPRPNDVLGLLFLSLAFLFIFALYSYDRYDLPFDVVPANPHVHNWIGNIGARLAYGMFKIFGAAAYLVPIAFFFAGLGYLFQVLFYLQRRWLWTGVLLVSCMGVLDLYSANFSNL